MKKDITLLQGKTFSLAVRWETSPIIYKAITNMLQTAPCSITCVGHGAPDGWRIAVVSAKGMTELNAKNNPPKDEDYFTATVVDVDTLELNSVSSAGFKAYTTGGYIAYNTPQSLLGFSARMQIKDKVGGTVLASSEVADTPLDTITIDIDDALKVITVSIAATDTAALTFTKGVYELEMVSPTGVVTSLLVGKVSVTNEVTT